jgi:hypothetical protein
MYMHMLVLLMACHSPDCGEADGVCTEPTNDLLSTVGTTPGQGLRTYNPCMGACSCHGCEHSSHASGLGPTVQRIAWLRAGAA